jgi:DNA-binding response OmpR family regulator
MKASSEMENSRSVLMIDDDVKLCRLVSDYLAPFGFSVGTAYNGHDGLDKIKNEEFQAVILDVMLPGIDGFTVLKQIRQFSDVPVLMLTALGDESDRIVGLEIGADDYLPKTFSTRELLARLRAVTRRSQMNGAARKNEGDEIVIGDIYINQATREVKVSGEAVALTALEFDLLLSLMRAAGRVLDRDTLLDAVAGRSYDVFDRSVDVHISSLRRKLGDDSKHPRYIKTIRSVGYMLVSSDADEVGEEESP